MINLDFMPSRQLALYAAKMFITRSLAVLLALVMVLMALDLLGESGKILAIAGDGEAEIWRYVSLRVPLLIARFLPFSVLLGALIAFTSLNQHSEVVAMKAAGLSAHQILAPMIVTSLVLAAAQFVFNETVVVRSARAVGAWTDAEYRPVPPDSGLLSNVWLKVGDDLLHADQVSGPGASRIDGLTIYERSGGELAGITEAARAVRLPSGEWRMTDLRTFDPSRTQVGTQPEALGLRGVEPEQLRLAKVDPAEEDFFSLRRSIADLEASGRTADEARTGWWHKLSGPLSTLLMPLLAATAAFGLARSGKVLLRATIGMALGFTYFVADNLSVALGNFGAYPPFIAAWAPFLLFLLIGELVLIRQEE